MEANLIVPKQILGHYIHGLLKHLIDYSGIYKESEVEFLSICDPTEMGILFAPRTRPLRIVGGANAFNDHITSMFADVVVVGEGYEFFKKYKFSQSLSDTMELSCCLRPGARIEKAVIPSTKVDWSLTPPMKLGRKWVYMVGSRGCKNKCKFCYSAWTTPHSVNPFNHQTLIIPPKRTLSIIGNDSYGVIEKRVSARSMLLNDYITLNTDQLQKCNVYRLGIESFTEEGRKKLGKPIKNESIRIACNIALKFKHDLIFYVIAGLEPQESIHEFIDAVGYGKVFSPRLMVKPIHFKPCLHTPLEAFDMRTFHVWDKRWIYSELNAKNPRFRLNMAADAGWSFCQTFMMRSRTPEEVKHFWSLRKKPMEFLINEVVRRDAEYLFDTPPPTKIKFGWR